MSVIQEADLHVTGGKVVCDDGVLEREIYINDGVVMAVSAEPLPISARATLRVSGQWVWPGFIDTHVHFADPGYTDREDFGTGTEAALAGGITTVVEMPNTEPIVADLAGLDAKLKSASSKAVVDFGLWGALTPGGVNKLAELRHSGIRLFKGFMYEVTRGLPKLSDWDLLECLKRSRELDIVIAVHPENHDLIVGATDALETQPPNRYGEDHPIVAEEEAVMRAAFLAERTGGRLHIVHASGGSIVKQVKGARDRGVRISVETCPHYLAFTEEDGRNEGAWLRCAPPLRSGDEREALWERLVDGQVDTIVSDHSPASAATKHAGGSNLLNAPNGFPGVQTLIPYLLSMGVNDGALPPQVAYQLCSKHPAQLSGLYPRKGAIDPGSDADFVVVDMDKSWVLSQTDLRYKNRWSPWVDHEFSAHISRVYVRGVEALADGEIKVGAGFGHYLPAEIGQL